jgi:hypothetical protein
MDTRVPKRMLAVPPLHYLEIAPGSLGLVIRSSNFLSHLVVQLSQIVLAA